MLKNNKIKIVIFFGISLSLLSLTSCGPNKLDWNTDSNRESFALYLNKYAEIKININKKLRKIKRLLIQGDTLSVTISSTKKNVGGSNTKVSILGDTLDSIENASNLDNFEFNKNNSTVNILPEFNQRMKDLNNLVKTANKEMFQLTHFKNTDLLDNFIKEDAYIKGMDILDQTIQSIQ